MGELPTLNPALLIEPSESRSAEEAERRESAAAGRYEALCTALMLGLRTDGGVALTTLRDEFADRGLGAIAVDACIEAVNQLPSDWVALESVKEQVVASAAGAPTAAAPMPNDEATPELMCAAELHAQRLRLKAPEGFLFSNEAISTIFARMDAAVERMGIKGSEGENMHASPSEMR